MFHPHPTQVMKTLFENNLKASEQPLMDLERIAYPGQPEHLRMYKPGYEHFMGFMPVLSNDSDTLEEDVALTGRVAKRLMDRLIEDGWTSKNVPAPGKFKRTIIAIEEPGIDNAGNVIPKAELIVAQWGEGFKSPVHGHATGYLLEAILYGRIKVHTYRIVDNINKVVRPFRTEIVKKGIFVSKYEPHNENNLHKQQALVHNFEAIDVAASLHYVPEHTNDGRSNTFKVEHWADVDPLYTDRVERITSQQGMSLQIGEVVLVRSSNVPEYGDHFVVVTGHPIMKEHGMRVQDESIQASEHDSSLLDHYPTKMGLTLLKLKPEAQKSFLHFHGITVENREVKFSTI